MIRVFHLRSADDVPVLRAQAAMSDADRVARAIIEAVRAEGDKALLRYARELDGWSGSSLRVSEEELAAARRRLSPEMRRAAETAIANIGEFAAAQMPRERFEDFSPGRKLGWIVRPLEAVGCYVPSGRYPLPSTLLMTAVLAQTAGVRRICVVSPKPSVEILGCAHLLGIEEVYRAGGAQAIAALALGTESIPRVDRIVGPGNVYVSAAKKLLAGETGIDFVAGPTEILIVAFEGDEELIAADMLAQAEHDPLASALLVTTSPVLAGRVSLALERQLASLPTADVARRAIDCSSGIFVVPDVQVAVDVANGYAPEHLSLHDATLLPRIKNAGTVFLGPMSPESAGDYAAGPSHVLPTGGMARIRGGLSVFDFVKLIAVQQFSAEGLEQLAGTITALARAEGLEAHARAVEVRSVNQA